MEKENPVFKRTYQDYLLKLQQLDFPEVARRLGVKFVDNALHIPFFNRMYRLSADGIINPSGAIASFDVCVILFKYVTMCPEAIPQDKAWASYKDFPDAAPLVNTFRNRAEGGVTDRFAGKLEKLESACQIMQAQRPEIELSYSLSRQFQALPTIPLLLLFNDVDEEFPAQCSILFERRVEHYLDMESLAILGMLFAGYLNKAA